MANRHTMSKMKGSPTHSFVRNHQRRGQASRVDPNKSDSSMDFSKFRGSGDLSDITVIIDGAEFKLHKFPLFAKSDYFCELARSHPKNDSELVHVDLKNFPGGPEVFGLVADFCYNMPTVITKNNVIAVKCAALYLKMFGTGNLVEVANDSLQETLKTAKGSRDTSVLVNLLMQCRDVGELADNVGVVSECVDAFVQSWTQKSKNGLKPNFTTSAFRRIRPRGRTEEMDDKMDLASLQDIILLPPAWVAKILVKAKNASAKTEDLGGLAVKYVTLILDLDREDLDSFRENEAEYEDHGDTNSEKYPPPSLSQSSDALLEKPSVDLKYALDTVLMVLPEQAFDIPAVTVEWLTKVLRMATILGCKSKGHLVRVAGNLLTWLSPEDLCVISPSVLQDIVAEAMNGTDDDSDNRPMHSNRACKLVDTYMLEMSAKRSLSLETFSRLVAATKNHPRQSHDLLFEVLENVIKAEGDSITPEQRAELPELINLDMLSEGCLERAMDSQLVSPRRVANSALKLCIKLRAEIAEMTSSRRFMERENRENREKFRQRSVSPRGSPSNGSGSSPPTIVGSFSARALDSGYSDIPERSKSPARSLDGNDMDQRSYHSDEGPEPVQPARNKLNLYTGHRPAPAHHLFSPRGASSTSISRVLHDNHHFHPETRHRHSGLEGKHHDRPWSYHSRETRLRHNSRLGSSPNHFYARSRQPFFSFK